MEIMREIKEGESRERERERERERRTLDPAQRPLSRDDGFIVASVSFPLALLIFSTALFLHEVLESITI